MKGIMFDFQMIKVILMQLHLLGNYSMLKYKTDWSIQTWKEIEIVGTLMYGMEPYKKNTMHCFDLALHLLQQNPDMFKGIMTHTFPIDEYKNALNTARIKKKSHAIKAAFDFRQR